MMLLMWRKFSKIYKKIKILRQELFETINTDLIKMYYKATYKFNS